MLLLVSLSYVRLLWKVVPLKVAPLKLFRGKIAFAVGTGSSVNTSPAWCTAMDLDDYEAVPTKIISPTHMYVYG